jgi:hypothetical protein
VLRRAGLITDWHDRDIDAGTAWQEEIDRHLLSADIVLLLVSASFIASDYCWGDEMKKALARHKEKQARVIPIILHPCRASTPSPPHPTPLPQAGEGDHPDAAVTPRPPAGEGGTRDSGRMRAKEEPVPKDGVCGGGHLA